MDMVHLPGKGIGSRRVPLIITPDVTRAMDVLVSTRKQCGIPQSNPFFFATATQNGYFDAWQVMRNVASEAGLDKPELIQSTNMRKYMATVTQVSGLFCLMTEAML